MDPTGITIPGKAGENGVLFVLRLATGVSRMRTPPHEVAANPQRGRMAQRRGRTASLTAGRRRILLSVDLDVFFGAAMGDGDHDADADQDRHSN
jgi:hypothetical protein